MSADEITQKGMKEVNRFIKQNKVIIDNIEIDKEGKVHLFYINNLESEDK